MGGRSFTKKGGLSVVSAGNRTWTWRKVHMASPSSGMQQKVSMYAMNVFFLFLFYSFPSGLNLYYSVFNILSIVQQKYLTPAPTKKQTAVRKPPKKK